MADKGGKIRFAEELFKRETQPLLDLTILQCYKNAYPNQTGTDNTMSSEASGLMKDPKVTQRLEELKVKVDKAIIYGVEECFNEFELLRKDALNDKDRNIQKACIENKGKLKQLFVEQKNITGVIGLNEVSDEAFAETMDKVNK